LSKHYKKTACKFRKTAILTLGWLCHHPFEGWCEDVPRKPNIRYVNAWSKGL